MKITPLPIKKAILVTRPNHDLVTTYISTWAKIILTEADKRGIQKLDLASKKANRKYQVLLGDHSAKL